MIIVLDMGRKSGDNAVDVILCQRNLQFKLAHHLDLSDARPGRNLLTLGYPHITQLSAYGSPNHQLLGATLHSRQFLVGFHPVGSNHLALQSGRYGIMLQVLHLQEHLLPLIFVIFLSHFQFRLTLNAHTIFLSALLERFLQVRHLMLGIQGLLAKVDGLLRHLNLLFLTVAKLAAPCILLIIDRMIEFRILKHQDGIALLQHGSFFCHHPFHESVLHRIHLDGLEGLHQSFYIYILPERNLLYFGYHHAIHIHPSGARSNDQEKGIDQDGNACYARQDRIAVTDIPRFRLFLYIHIVLLLFIIL